MLLAEQGEHEEADALLREAIERSRRTLGDDNQATLLVLNNLGMLLLRRGLASEAEPLLREVLETSRRTLGADHPQTLMSVDNFRKVTESLAR